MKRPTVHNVYKENTKYPDDVFIGRPSIWGNPYPIVARIRTREQVIELYRKYILGKPELLKQLPELAGKRLICFCSPQACHGDVLADLVAKL